MPFLIDTDVLIDLARNRPGCAKYLDSLGDEWSVSAISAMEFLSGAKNQREVDKFDFFLSTYDIAPPRSRSA